MTRTPDEIKKGLECCATVKVGGVCPFDCPLQPLCASGDDGAVQREILALIQQLQHNNAQLAIDKAKLAAENAEQADRIRQLETDLDAMKDEIDCDCETCKHSEACQEDGYCMWCENKESNKTPCCNCVYGSNWEWRGVQKEE